ncbi:MAG: lysylphosphatidylglycerol synthase transmembrane domain-containing protein [Lautropia sp.]|nr:lysylphosphatidylglycerol synthase transmembrane domain-containing protein [Lautropia sp.]
MKLKRPLIGFAIITLLYLGMLIWVDAGKQVFAQIPLLWKALPLMLALALLSYLIRFARWQWLLYRMGHRPPPLRSLLAYLAGFAFTATPGKVGELVRIRYLLPQGVPAWKTLSVFVYERAFDLIAVLALAMLYLRSPELLAFVSAFVAAFITAIVVTATRPRLLSRLIARLQAWHMRRLARLLRTLRDGLQGCRQLNTLPDAIAAFFLGLLAWLFTAFAFSCLLNQLGIQLPLLTSLSMYPVAMLAGAASMIPGGLGSTEATLVALLMNEGVALKTAMLAAVGIRLASLWFSILLGLAAVVFLETAENSGAMVAISPDTTDRPRTAPDLSPP